MEETIKIFGIEIENITAKETMKKAVEMLDQEGLSLVELLTMDTLLLGQDDAELKEAVGEMDLVLSGSAELYEAAEIQEARCLQRPSERPFIQMFLKYLQKSKKRVYLLTESEPEKEILLSMLEEKFRGMMIVGSGAFPEECSDEMVVNEVNGLEADCILSVLPSPRQELFAVRNRALLNVHMWLGCSNLIQEKYEEAMHIHRFHNFLVRKFFKHQVGLEKRQDEE